MAPARPPLDKRQDFGVILGVAWLYTMIAGMLNGVAVYELGTPVGYTSGPCVNAGRFLATGDANAPKILGIITLFYAGGILAGLAGKHAEGDHVFEGRMSPAMMVSAAMLAFGVYAKKNLNRPTLAMQTWALSQGLMNGVSSRFSAVPIRATHTAGGQTDAAITVANALVALSKGTVVPSMRKVILNAICCGGMVFGGWWAGKYHKKWGTMAGLVPAGLLAFSATALPTIIALGSGKEEEDSEAKTSK
mmetsp:Transcript_26175/g.55425  ORF Transcript_26175/g.55425 Transcript_26175/m.55425 type:complete len:248 (+) Transcript_26175:58-801(+)